jgi:hypothetical protein
MVRPMRRPRPDREIYNRDGWRPEPLIAPLAGDRALGGDTIPADPLSPPPFAVHGSAARSDELDFAPAGRYLSCAASRRR